MAVIGANAIMGDLSYLAVGREITYGTLVTGTAGLNFNTASLMAKKTVKVLDEIQTSRTQSNQISLGKIVDGDIEFFFSPMTPACNYLLQNAFGGGPTLASVTCAADTTGGLGFTHTLGIANYDTTYSSLSLNLRKGDSATGKIFEYCGVRVNDWTFNAVMDEPLKVSCAVIAKDVTQTTNDVAGTMSSTNAQRPLSFVNGRFSIESTLASITSSVFWHVQSLTFKINNNLQAVRRIGSDTIGQLPAGIAKFDLSCQMRFDTITAWSAMIAGNQRFCAEFEFQEDAVMTGSLAKAGVKLTFPYVVILDAGDPKIAGPSKELLSDVKFAVLRDPTTSGYAVKAYVTNLTANYT